MSIVALLIIWLVEMHFDSKKSTSCFCCFGLEDNEALASYYAKQSIYLANTTENFIGLLAMTLYYFGSELQL